MRFFASPRRVAVIVIAVVAVGAGCWPRPVRSPIASMSTAEETAILALTKWVGCTTVRRESTVAGDSVDVTICADTGARRFGRNNPPAGAKGRAVGQIRTGAGNRDEGRWGLEPNSTYYIWLSGPAGGPTTWTIKGPGVFVEGPLRGCGHPPAGSDSASFGTCADNRPSAAMSRGPNERSGASSPDGGTVKFVHTLLDRATGPAWISCTEGCCTTDAS